MFTGIIETLGEVVDIHIVQKNVEIYISSIFSTDLKIDQSIAHNGVCLTVDQTAPSWHRCTLIAETLIKAILIIFKKVILSILKGPSSLEAD